MSKRCALLALWLGLWVSSAAWAQNCSGDADCEDGNLCTDDICIILPFPGGFCSFLPNAEACDDANVCTSGDVCSNGSCVGTPTPDCSCAVSLALEGQSQRERLLGVFRDYRDFVLGSTLEGRGLSALYYRHSEEVAAILDDNPLLRLDAALLLVRLAPVAWNAANGQDAVLSRADVSGLDRLIASIQRRSGEELAADLQALRDALTRREIPKALAVRIAVDRTSNK